MKRLLWLVFKRANMPRDLRKMLLHYCRHVVFDYETRMLRRERMQMMARCSVSRRVYYAKTVMENFREQVDEYWCQCGTCTWWSFRKGPYQYRWRCLTREEFHDEQHEDE